MYKIDGASLAAQCKESACKAGDTGAMGSIPRSSLQDPLEGMAIHSSILAWEIPWTEESGGLLTKGSQGLKT